MGIFDLGSELQYVREDSFEGGLKNDPGLTRTVSAISSISPLFRKGILTDVLQFTAEVKDSHMYGHAQCFFIARTHTPLRPDVRHFFIRLLVLAGLDPESGTLPYRVTQFCTPLP